MSNVLHVTEGMHWLFTPAELSDMTLLPDDVGPLGGCPECGAVWTGIWQVGVLPRAGRVTDLIRTGTWPFGDDWLVRTEASHLGRPLGVRLLCFSDHVVEYVHDSRNGVVRGLAHELIARDILTLAIVGGGAALGVWVLGRYIARTKGAS